MMKNIRDYTEIKIFLTHQWYSIQYPVGGGLSNFERLFGWLAETEGWVIRDFSVPPNLGLYDTRRVSEINGYLKRRMSKCDVIISASAGVAFDYRPWFRREARLARSSTFGPKPVLAVRHEGAYWWSSFFTERADAWAIWTRESVVNGVRSLLDLTPKKRAELLGRAGPCKMCGRRRARLELNRLRGAYCAACGAVAYRIGLRKLHRWRDWDRVDQRH